MGAKTKPTSKGPRDGVVDGIARSSEKLWPAFKKMEKKSLKFRTTKVKQKSATVKGGPAQMYGQSKKGGRQQQQKRESLGQIAIDSNTFVSQNNKPSKHAPQEKRKNVQQNISK